MRQHPGKEEAVRKMGKVQQQVMMLSTHRVIEIRLKIEGPRKGELQFSLMTSRMFLRITSGS